ncbi:protein OS-9-like isoform X1 [Ornithodoros turicata]|uniref:protein OS-9-like isoform X1 n=2 Tax=Ornithodoros turicata TaxID=34597 RepID=UPI00313991E5
MFRLLTLLLISSYDALCFLNLEEIRSFNYDIDILSTPVKTGEETRQSVMLMTSKFGQDYQCSLPEEPSTSESADASTDETDVPNVIKLLEPLRNGPCLTKTKNWWTYELCYGQSIKQFHIENGKPEGAIIYLGLYESDFDWNNLTNLEQLNKSGQQKYHSQIYNRGSNCDITGVHRRSEVRYYCEEDSADYIYAVEEPETCSYIFTIHTSRVCSFPPLKPPASPKPHTIHCSPLLSEEQFQKYLEIKEKERIAEEEKRKIWLLEQQKNLAAIKAIVAKKQGVGVSDQEPAEDVGANDDSEHDTSSAVEQERVQENQGVNEEEEEHADMSENGEADVDNQHAASVDGLPEDTDTTMQDTEGNDAEHASADARGELGSGIAEQFKELLNEAEQELQDEAYGHFKESYLKLDSTIERLMKQINDAEKTVAKGTSQPDKASPEEHSGESDSGDAPNAALEDEETPAEGFHTKGDEESEDAEEDDKEEEAESENMQKKNVFDDGKLRVRIQRIDARQLAKAKDKATYKEQELHSEDKAKLESALKERLQKAGLDTEGRKIEVKIITAGFFDDDEEKDLKMLSPEETQQFQNMIVTLLMGNQEAIQEVERQERLEKNYQFVWGEDLSVKSENDDSDR